MFCALITKMATAGTIQVKSEVTKAIKSVLPVKRFTFTPASGVVGEKQVTRIGAYLCTCLYTCLRTFLYTCPFTCQHQCCQDSHGQYSHGLYSHGLYNYGLLTYGLYTYGPYSYGAQVTVIDVEMKSGFGLQIGSPLKLALYTLNLKIKKPFELE